MRTSIVSSALAALVAAPVAAQPSNPIAQAIAIEMHNHAENMVPAAEAMPAEKYTFKPSPDQISFADLIYHAASANDTLCAAVAGERAPDTTAKASAPKQALVDQLKQSFAYCDSVFGRFDPATVGTEVQVFGRTTTRAWLLFHLALDWGDHYSQAAAMLRLNGLVPPSAQRRAR